MIFVESTKKLKAQIWSRFPRSVAAVLPGETGGEAPVPSSNSTQ